MPSPLPTAQVRCAPWQVPMSSTAYAVIWIWAHFLTFCAQAGTAQQIQSHASVRHTKQAMEQKDQPRILNKHPLDWPWTIIYK